MERESGGRLIKRPINNYGCTSKEVKKGAKMVAGGTVGRTGEKEGDSYFYEGQLLFIVFFCSCFGLRHE